MQTSFYSPVDHILREILLVIYPSRDDWEVRFQILADVRATVQTVESLRGATVEPFGSFVSNLFTKWGDLDISIEILTGVFITNTAKKQKQTYLADVLKALRRKGTWRKLRLIGNARVPILKLEHNLQNISCDISINNLHGQMKSKLLFWLNEIDGRFRDIVLLVKEWAKAHDINDSKSGSLNSYSLSLLVIFHFQTCVPAILPPLKEIYAGNMSHDLIGVRTDAEKHIEETCAVNINRFRLDRSRCINQSPLSVLLISFFAKFSDISLRAKNQGISPYTGQWEDIEGNMAWLPRTYALYVEDPLEQPVNTARTVTDKHLTRIAEAFQTTHRALTSAAHNSSTLFSLLLRRERLPSVTRPVPGINSGYPARNYPHTRPQANGAVPSPSQAHHARPTRVNGRPNNANTIRPVQSNNHNQTQQIWRARPSS